MTTPPTTPPTVQTQGQSETPRSDAEDKAWGDKITLNIERDEPLIPAFDFARTLERELTAKDAQLAEARNLLARFAKWDADHPKSTVHDFKAERVLDSLFEEAKSLTATDR